MSAAGGGPPGHSDALRILLSLSTPLSCNLTRAAMAEEKAQVEFDRNRDRELPEQPDIFLVRIAWDRWLQLS